MGKCLFIVQGYPNEENKYCNNFVHSRVLEFKKNKYFDIEVLNFSTKRSYQYDGINVLCLNEFLEKESQVIDIIISHAPNIRSHAYFLIRYLKKYKSVIFVIHGHEVMISKKDYSIPYLFVAKKYRMKNYLTNCYDYLKLFILKYLFLYLLKNKNAHFIFVSQWMKKIFLKNIKISSNVISKRSKIINNNCNKVFLERNYYTHPNIYADCITIRPFDNSKYGIDLVVKLAQSNPNCTFHIYGKGEYFNHNSIPENVKVIYKFFSPDEIVDLLPHYKCAVMPTRVDSQGVMVCEMATFGMPVITSNIDVCRDLLRNFNNIGYLENENIEEFNLENFLYCINYESSLNKEKFSVKNTIEKEIKYTFRVNGKK